LLSCQAVCLGERRIKNFESAWLRSPAVNRKEIESNKCKSKRPTQRCPVHLGSHRIKWVHELLIPRNCFKCRYASEFPGESAFESRGGLQHRELAMGHQCSAAGASKNELSRLSQLRPINGLVMGRVWDMRALSSSFRDWPPITGHRKLSAHD
jgi:hypothetical protein